MRCPQCGEDKTVKNGSFYGSAPPICGSALDCFHPTYDSALLCIPSIFVLALHGRASVLPKAGRIYRLSLSGQQSFAALIPKQLSGFLDFVA